MADTCVTTATRWRVWGPTAALPLAAWSFAYAGYRAYYALGGDVGMIGRPVSDSQLRAVNAVGAAIIVLAGVLLLVAIRLAPLRRALPAIGWVGAVGCCMHALTDITLRLLSVTGVRPTQLPASVWRSLIGRQPICKTCCSMSPGSSSRVCCGPPSASVSSAHPGGARGCCRRSWHAQR